MVVMMMMEVWKNSVIMYGEMITYALQEKKKKCLYCNRIFLCTLDISTDFKNWIVPIGLFKMKGTFDIYMTSTYY